MIQGTNVVSIRSQEDMLDVWKDIKIKLVTWYDGLRAFKHKQRQTGQTDENNSDDDRENLKSKKAKKMEEGASHRVKELKPQCNSHIIWSEMVVGEMHSSLDEPPCTSMFVRAGNRSSNAKKKDQVGHPRR